MVSAARIDYLTARVTEYRLWRHIRRAEQIRGLEAYVALELKGLKAKAMVARAHIGKLDQAYEAFNAKAASHVADVQGLAEQLGYMSDDLSFATAALGNSVADSNASTEAIQPATAPPPDFTFKPLPDSPAAPQTAIASGGFTLTPTKIIEDTPAAPQPTTPEGWSFPNFQPGMRGRDVADPAPSHPPGS